MACKSCDAPLTDFESSIRSNITGEYFDMCIRCLSYIRSDIETKENFALFNPKVDDLDVVLERNNTIRITDEDTTNDPNEQHITDED